jgi:hypothetical protein
MPVLKCERLIVFTRFPEPGTTKTRLIPALGEKGAADLQRRMTEHIISTAAKVSNRPGLSIEVRYEGADPDLMQAWLGPQFTYSMQGSGDLGRRMARAFDEVFQTETEAAVIIGCDIPGITANIILQAFEGLQKNDLVLGPARDGGYYLVGKKRAIAADANHLLFSGIKWGSEEVFTQTLQIAKRSGLSFILLEPLADVDRPEDLHIWHEFKNHAANPAEAQRISIIIPTLNEAPTIAETICHLKDLNSLEVIVVDGGSEDDTVELARSSGAEVIQATPCKAVQMNAGASVAGGDVLVFLHADTLLPKHFKRQILSAVNQNGVAAGAFRLTIDSTAKGIRFIERMTYLRSRYLRMPYGDQALFMKKTLFEKIGGFPELPIMEDFILIRRLRRQGKIVILSESVITSPRRWLHLGIFKTWLINQLIIIAYYLDIPPERLTRWYRREEDKTGN